MAIEKDIAIKCDGQKYGGAKGTASLIDYIKDNHHDKSKTSVGEVIDYGKNPNKTTVDPSLMKDVFSRKSVLISSISNGELCRELDEIDFMEDKERYKEYKKGDRRGYGRVDKGEANERDAYHVIQSFPGAEHGVELDPRLAHQMGVEYAKRAFPGHKVIVTTHMNTDHLHNHIAVCAYSEDGTHKLNFNSAFRRDIRKINDEISLEYGLPILDGHKRYKRRNTELNEERVRAKHGPTMKDQVRDDIKSVLEHHGSEFKSFNGFVAYMEENMGYTITQTAKKVTFQKNGLLQKNGQPFKVKDSTLGDNYTRRAICETNGYPKWSGTDKNGKHIEEQEEYSSEKEDRIKGYLDTIRQVGDEDLHIETDIMEDNRLKSKPFTLHIPRYTESGRRRSDLELVILAAIQIFKLIRDKIFRRNKNIENKETIGLDGEIQKYKNALTQAQKYNVNSFSELMTMRNDLSKVVSELKGELLFYDRKAKEDDVAMEMVKTYKTIAGILLKSGIEIIDDLLCVYKPKQEEITLFDRQNMPISGRQKQKLYQLLNEDGQKYRLKCKFDELSHKEADEVIKFLTGNITNKPAIVADPSEQQAEKLRRLCEKRFENIEKYKAERFAEPISKGLIAKLKPFITEDGITIDLEKLTKGQGMSLLQHYKDIPITDDSTITKTQIAAIDKRLEEKGLSLNKPTEYILKSEYDQLKKYLDTGKGEIPEVLSEFTPMSISTRERVKAALTVAGKELVIPMDYISEKQAKILESDLLYKTFTPSILKQNDKTLTPEQIKDVNKEKEAEFLKNIARYPKSVQELLKTARESVINLQRKGLDISAEDGIKSDVIHDKFIQQQITTELAEIEVGYSNIDKLATIADTALKIKKDPTKFIKLNYARYLEKPPVREEFKDITERVSVRSVGKDKDSIIYPTMEGHEYRITLFNCRDYEDADLDKQKALTTILYNAGAFECDNFTEMKDIITEEMVITDINFGYYPFAIQRTLPEGADVKEYLEKIMDIQPLEVALIEEDGKEVCVVGKTAKGYHYLDKDEFMNKDMFRRICEENEEHKDEVEIKTSEPETKKSNIWLDSSIGR